MRRNRTAIARRLVRLAAVALVWQSRVAAAASSAIDVPDGWFSGDVHLHSPQPQCCCGVGDPERALLASPDDLNVLSMLIWCSRIGYEFDRDHRFLGRQDHPVSTPTQIVHLDLEVSHCGNADRLGHMNYLYLEDIYFPEADYQGPIQEWAHAQGAVVGADHSQWFAPSFDEFTPHRSAAQYEAPVGVALGRVDFISYQPTPNDPDVFRTWTHLWYRLLDSGFRPGLAATSDSGCIPNRLGTVRTYARLEGELTYEKFVRAIAAGRVTIVEDDRGFIDLSVNGAQTGEETHVASSSDLLQLEARLLLPRGVKSVGRLEVLRNGEVAASRGYDQTGGEVVLSFARSADESSWWAARTLRSHSGAVFSLVDGRPVRGAARSPEYFVQYLDWLADLVETGFFDAEEPTDDSQLLADIAEARDIFERVRREASGEDVPIPEPPEAPLAALALLALLGLVWGRSRALARRRAARG